MASAKRKQDEKNLKILRELVSQPGNKECFDCRQRGPTYVNMTIGSFVCTSCSGMLRGLTPPHRVKSISMATFIPEEIEYIKERGNDYCRRIWLGLADPPTPKILDIKDEEKMKDLMISKYELKRYYLDPSILKRSRIHKSPTTSAKSNETAIPRVPQPGTTTPISSQAQKTKKSEPVKTKAFNVDFGADFSQVPDPFSAATPTLQFNQQFTPQPSFANFDNNPVFNSPKSTDSSFSSNEVTGSFANFNGITKPPSEDRYAALKDLDSLMKQTQLKEEPVIPPTSVWDSNNITNTNQIWGGNNQTTNVISNPFTSENAWQPTVNSINNNNNSQPMDNACNSVNPFRTIQFSSNNAEQQWFGVGLPGNGDVVSSSQLMTPFSSKAWQPKVTSYHANPFMVGSGVGTTTRNTNNPFL
ncbi:arf-GAP domain and FG repeat-containing protein 1 isoform X1 [Neodiprion pinetum]|uniref:arf-GAP domain and FG repeat-containing protein 1 isoform X1 n=1 Tax=Neodiprion pinetum TaxID=441929 RepID=UPI001EDE0EB8|nr:arf-GAP domain and FG repeat-containing protein 1 isoform X1 [Neodiprion pinetum]